MNTRNPINLVLGAWNVRTTNDTNDSFRPERATAIITRELAKANIDICALSEVRREGQGNLVEKDYTIYWSGGTKKEAGVGFAISNKLSSFEMTTVSISDRLMVLRILLNSGKYLKLVSVYAPTMQRTQEEKELFYQSLTDVLRSDKDDLYIILGDFNARVGSDWQLWPDVLGKHGIGKMNANGLMLLDFCTQNSFIVMGTVFQLPNKFKTSWQHLRSKHWHQIDHILADSQTRPYISVTKTYLDADCYSDHKLVICKCSFRLSRKSKGTKAPSRPKYNITQEKIFEFQRLLDEDLTDCEINWENLKTSLLSATSIVLPKQKKRNQDWFDENDKQILTLLKDKNLNRREIQQRVRQIKNDWFTQKASEAEKYRLENNMKDFYSTLREVYGPSSRNSHPIKSKDGRLLTTKNEIKERWVEHFSELLNNVTETDETVLDEIEQRPVDNSLDEPITEKELDDAIKRSKLGKSPGPDGIIPEAISYGGQSVRNFIFSLFTIFWTTLQLPSDLIDPNITVLFKKGDRSICGNYRGISLLSCVGKIFADIVLHRIQKLVNNLYPDSQHGYRNERGTIDGIFTVRQLMEKSREQSRNLYIVFIDFTKAFDTVNRPLLFKLLSKIGCPPNLLKTIQLLYSEVKARLVIEGELSNPFNYDCGVKQGCKLAPTLYGLYAAMALWIAFKDNNEHSIYVRFRTDGNLFDLRRLKAKTKTFYMYIREAQYADDIAVFSDSAEGLQSLLTSYHLSAKRFGLQINAKKTEVMCLGPQCDFFIDETKLESTDRFKYLGSILSKDSNLKDELTTRIQATSCAYGRLKERVFNNRDLTTRTKVTVFNQCLMPILLYGSETWTLYAHEVKQLRTVQQRHLRNIMRIKWDDFVSNEEVLKRSNSTDVEVILAKNRLRWLGHVARMDSSRTVKQLFYGELVQGNRPIGRPRLRYKDNIKALLKTGGILQSWNESVLDRPTWRRNVSFVCEKLNEKRVEMYERRKERRKR